MTWQGLVELMLFFVMVIAMWLASYELLFPPQKNPNPTTEKKDAEEEG